MDASYFFDTSLSIENAWIMPEPFKVPLQSEIDAKQLQIISLMSPYLVTQSLNWQRIEQYITLFKQTQSYSNEDIQALLKIVIKKVYHISAPNVGIILKDIFDILNQTQTLNMFFQMFLDLQIMARRLLKTNDQYLFTCLCGVSSMQPQKFLELLFRLIDINQKLEISDVKIEEIGCLFLKKVQKFIQIPKPSRKQIQNFLKLISTIMIDCKASVNPLLKISNVLLKQEFSQCFIPFCERIDKYYNIYLWLQFVVKNDPNNTGAIRIFLYILQNNSQNLQRIKILEILSKSRQFAQRCAEQYFQLSQAFVSDTFIQSAFKIDSPQAIRIENQLLNTRYGVWIFIELANAARWPEKMLFFNIIDNVNYLGTLESYYLYDQDIITRSSLLLKKLIQNYDQIRQQVPFLDQ